MSYIANHFFNMIHLVFIFQNNFFYCTNRVPKNQDQCWYFPCAFSDLDLLMIPISFVPMVAQGLLTPGWSLASVTWGH